MLSIGALVTSVGAVIGAFIAVITGLLAKPLIPRGTQAEIVGGSHETLGYVLLACTMAFAAMKLWHYFRNDDRVLTPLMAVGLAGIVVAFITAHEGGELVYTHGVGVRKTPPENPLKDYPYGTAPWKEQLDATDSLDVSDTTNIP
jgi:uncharacterized membrane protein